MSHFTDNPRRRFLRRATGGVAAVGAVGTAVPFVASMTPSARAKALGAPLEVDISQLQPGAMQIEEWRGKPVWIVRRTPEMLASIADSEALVADPESVGSEQPEYALNKHRSPREDVLVLLGVCTHLGCAPLAKFETGEESDIGADWLGGFFCPCHGSKFDFAGRVYKAVPAPSNLPVPPYRFIDDNRILIGEDPEVA